MKKLMIAAAIVCAAVFAQAGAVNWTAMNIPASSSGAFTEDTTYKAYLFLGTDIAGVTKYLASSDTLDLEAFENASVADKTGSYIPAATKLNIGAGNNYGNYGEGDTVTAFMIIVDADDIADAKNYLVAQTSGGDKTITKTFGKSGNQNYAFGDQVTAKAAWNQIASVPEPTSAMLLLLGMAGLALRRRRA